MTMHDVKKQKRCFKVFVIVLNANLGGVTGKTQSSKYLCFNKWLRDFRAGAETLFKLTCNLTVLISSDNKCPSLTKKMSQFDNKCHNLTFPLATNVIIWHQMSYSDIKCYNLTFHLTSDFIYWQQMSYSNMKFKCHFLKLNTIIWLSIWQVMQSNIRCHHFYPTLSQVRSV